MAAINCVCSTAILLLIGQRFASIAKSSLDAVRVAKPMFLVAMSRDYLEKVEPLRADRLGNVWIISAGNSQSLGTIVEPYKMVIDARVGGVLLFGQAQTMHSSSIKLSATEHLQIIVDRRGPHRADFLSALQSCKYAESIRSSEGAKGVTVGNNRNFRGFVPDGKTIMALGDIMFNSMGLSASKGSIQSHHAGGFWVVTWHSKSNLDKKKKTIVIDDVSGRLLMVSDTDIISKAEWKRASESPHLLQIVVFK